MAVEKEKLSGMRLSFQYGTPPAELTKREIKREPTLRAKKLLDDYYEAKVSLDTEFPYWYTKTWRENEGQNPIIRRSLALKSAYEHLTPMIPSQELLAMQKTRFVRGSFMMPWTANRFALSDEEHMAHEAEAASLKSLEEITVIAEGGGNVTESAGNVLSISKRFGIRKEDYAALIEDCRYWKNKSSEDMGFMWGAMHPKYDEYLNIKKAVLVHVDLETSIRHGRNVVNYQYPLQIGFNGMIQECKDKIDANLNEGCVDKIAFWKGAINVIEGVKTWIKNYAKEAKRLAGIAKDNKAQQELLEMSERLEWISENPPRTFMEALQLCWTCHIAVTNEIQGSGFSPGRLGQVLYPFWKKDMEEGRITREQTIEALECMRVKFTGIDLAMAVGTIGLLAGSTFNNLCVGGVKPDGTSAENELEELIIESAISCATPQPTLTVLYDGKLSDKFIHKAIECNKTGTGYPAWVNNRIAMVYCLRNFRDEGITLEDARAWTIGGCLEIQPGALVNGEFGAGSYSSTGASFINAPKVLELVLFDGYDRRTKTQVFPPHGLELKTFEEVMTAWQKYMHELVVVLEEMYNIRASAFLEHDNPMFYSALMADCLETGLHMDKGGSRYNKCMTTWITGQVNLANSLASIKKNVFDDKNFTMDELKDTLINNFGYESALETGKFSMVEQIREDDKFAKIHAQCIAAPKYGNDDPYVDEIYKQVVEDWRDYVSEVKDFFGRSYVPCQLSVATHGPLGQACLASADGRLAGLTLADGAQSPYPGTDLNGPYAVLNSATVIDHSDYQNTQLNMKIHPSAIKGLTGAEKLKELIKAYMDKGGYHIQFNIVDTKMLKDAQANPQNYRDLMVRVAGFTQYWVELSKPIQDEIIARTEYEEV